MRDFWLKALGMGARGEPLPDDWKSWKSGLLGKALIFPRRPNIERGDGLILYAAGTRLIFAVGEATSYPYQRDGDSPWPWHIDIHYTHSRDFVHDGIPLTAIDVEGRGLPKLMRRRSHIRLRPREYDAAMQLLGE